jgi:transposase-like protein
MKDVTISTYEITKKFPNERATRIYLEKLRWDGCPVCPYCGCDKIQSRHIEGYFRCLTCTEDFTVRTGTIMERSHIPLDKWIMAMYLMVTARKGISSLQLSKEIGITQKSAWFLLQRLREACNNGHGILQGIVEADECYIGGKETNKHNSKKLKAGRGTVGKTAILGMRERNGMVKAMTIKGTDTETIQKKIKANVAPSSTLCTDEHAAYNGMEEYNHLEVNHSAKQFVDGMAHTNGIESVWAVLKRGFYGTYHNFGTKHIQRYIDEFTFRLNEGDCHIPSMDRVDSLIQGLFGKRLTYSSLKQEILD